MAWIISNLGTIIISFILIALVSGILTAMYKDKKKGKSLCGDNCGGCPMSGSCHNSKN